MRHYESRECTGCGGWHYDEPERFDEHGHCPVCTLVYAAGVAAEREARDEARGNARILAHSYERDCRPPQKVVRDSLAYPVVSESIRAREEKS